MNPQAPPDVIYPETDGEPIGETDLHIDWIFRLRDVLKRHFRGQQVYVATDLLLYYEEGVPRRFVVPDVFVVKNSRPDRRRVYKTWEEGQSPHFVMEVTSASTKLEDEVRKPGTYAKIGVGEYFLYDPTADYLRPALVGYRLDGNDYVPIEPDDSGRLYSAELELHLLLEDGQLVLCNAGSGEPLKSTEDAEREAEDAARAAQDAARAAQDAARAAQDAARAAQDTARAAVDANQAAQDEVRRLREILRQHGLDE